MSHCTTSRPTTRPTALPHGLSLLLDPRNNFSFISCAASLELMSPFMMADAMSLMICSWASDYAAFTSAQKMFFEL